MKRSPLSRVESLIRRVVEEPFTWFGGGSLDPFQLASHLVRVYDIPTADGRQINHFSIQVNPDDLLDIQAYGVSLLEQQVADYTVLMAGRRGYHLSEPPVIQFEPHPEEKMQSAHVIASWRDGQPHSDTEIYSVETSNNVQDAIREADAFLIIQGRQHIPLDRPVTRIGRRTENDIVLDSPSISRQHAQIRWRQRYFVLYDVSSHDRTSVNGTPIQEHILRPGDVIALSDILLVYGEGRDDLLGPSQLSESDEMDSTVLKPEE